MKLRLTFLLCALSLALPALAAAPNTGGPNWGGVSGTHKHQWHGECCYTDPIIHGGQPGAHHKGPTAGHVTGAAAVCNLAGVWKESPYSRAWGEKRLTLVRRDGKPLLEYSAKEFGIRGEVREHFSYNANRHEVQRFVFTQPDVFMYSVGKVSRDCRHISLKEYESDFATRNVQMTLVHH